MTRYDIWYKFIELAKKNKTEKIQMSDEELVMFCNTAGLTMIWDMEWVENMEDGSLGGSVGFNTFDGDESAEIYTNIHLPELQKLFRE